MRRRWRSISPAIATMSSCDGAGEGADSCAEPSRGMSFPARSAMRTAGLFSSTSPTCFGSSPASRAVCLFSARMGYRPST
jgi:hypothetical protein